MALLSTEENVEKADRSVPDVGFNWAFSLLMAICEHCKRSSMNSRFILRLPSHYDAPNQFSIGNGRQLLLGQLLDFAMQSHMFHTALAVPVCYERRK
jgi:hypothetical protein